MNNEARDISSKHTIHVPSVLDQTAKRDIARQMCDRWEAAVKKVDTFEAFLDGLHAALDQMVS